LAAHPNLQVIGVTGSYGKTSVKEYIATILAKKYAVLKTEASKNSPIGIAEVVNKKLTDNHEIFVVEMGAYKPGEIAYMSALVKPQIGFVTAINPQHQDLFGSIERTMEAKYELIAGLSGKNIALFNLDNDRCVQMSEQAKKDGKTVWYWTRNGKAKIDEPLFWADEIVATNRGVQFMCHFKREKHKIKVGVLGEHQVSNIIAAIAGAVAAGMEFSVAARAASAIQPAARVMDAGEGVNGSTFINDTFNNNPDAAKAAIAYLGAQSGKRILVFQPMIELGEYAKPSHSDVGANAARVADAIILTNPNFYHDFELGVRSVSQTVPLLVLNVQAAASYIRERVGVGDTVLFKGKEAEFVLKALK
jgi:UDP-N-acetylmuramoyl-tripeptide--D-alanyl-D-alanine ligase